MRLAAAVIVSLLGQGADLPVRIVDRGALSGIEQPRQVLVQTPAQLTALWREHSARPEPAIDFSRESVIGVFLGTRSTGGYSVEIVSVSRDASGSVVRYREIAPPAGAMTAQVLTFPFVLAAVPVLPSPVRFEPAR